MSPSPCVPAPSKLCIVFATIWTALGCHAAPAVVGRPVPQPKAPLASAPAPADTSGMGRFLDSLLLRMTLEEKLGQRNQPGGPGNDTVPAARADSEADIRAGRIVLRPGDLSFYGRDLRRIVEPGTCTVFVGSSSESVREAHFELAD